MFVIRLSIEEFESETNDGFICIEDNIEFGPSFESEADARQFIATLRFREVAKDGQS